MFLPPDYIPSPPKETTKEASTLAAAFANARNTKPLPWQIPEMFFGGGPPVADSEDLQRILALPRRTPPTEAEQAAMARAMTERLKRHRAPGECACPTLGRPCILSLNEVQGWALHELSQPDSEGRHGILGAIGVGKGKTILALLSAMVCPPWRVVALLVPPTLIPQLIRDYKALNEHFQVPTIIVPASGKTKAFSCHHPGRPTLHVLPYSKLSRAAATAYLATLKPDSVIADESHKLRNAQAVGTGRFLSLYDQLPSADHLPQSGSLTSRFLADYGHLSGLALREKSPLPLDPTVTTDWDRVLGAVDTPADMGALAQLCRPGEDVRAAFQRRLRETPGVIITDSPGCNASLVLLDRPLEIPPDLATALNDVRQNWTRPDGEEFVEVLEVVQCLAQLASGFYYRYKFPRQEPPALIETWRARRKDWHKELRQTLAGTRRPFLDSPLLLKQAAIRYYNGNYKGELPTWRSETWEAWNEIRTQVEPESEVQWISDFLIEDAADWARHHRGVVWTTHRAFEAKLAEVTGLTRYGAGSGESILKEKGDHTIIASLNSHGTGRDGLQYLFNEQYFAEIPDNGSELDQALGRLHRVGQSNSEVTAWIARHTEERRKMLSGALRDAKYCRETLGAPRQLLIADVGFEL